MKTTKLRAKLRLMDLFWWLPVIAPTVLLLTTLAGRA
jgi:hypothetical protein